MLFATLFISFLLFSPTIATAQEASDFQYKAENGGITIIKYTGTETDVVIPAQIDGLPVIAIERRAFFRLRLTSVILPPAIQTIGMWAFSQNKLKALVLPGTLTYIGDGAFTRNYISTVDVPASIKNFNSWAFDSWVKIIWR